MITNVIVGITVALKAVEWNLSVPLATTGFAAMFFSLMYQIGKIRLTADVFLRFNERYDSLNDNMNLIREGKILPNPHSIESVLDDYFNLCSEQYYLYQHGCIEPAVWEVWYKGMKFYLQKEQIAKYWSKQRHEKMHYGLEDDLQIPSGP